MTKSGSYTGKLAVVTGGGTGMGHELCLLLGAEGCDVAACDVNSKTLAETRRQFEEMSPAGTRISTHICDVSIADQVARFRAEVAAEHGEGVGVHLLFNNAGIGGGGSFVAGEESEWRKTFDVCWGGVYLCTRAFMDLLIAADQSHIVNVSSVNGFWANLGLGVPHTAYSAAKFAVKGFSEALITDLRVHAPHVAVSVVMPGHIGTDIFINSQDVLGNAQPLEMSAEEVAEAREAMQAQARAGSLALQSISIDSLSDDEIRQMVHQRGVDFREKAPTTAAQAASIILEGVRAGRWRILVGEDAQALDKAVRAHPEEAYEASFLNRLQEAGYFNAIVEPAES